MSYLPYGQSGVFGWSAAVSGSVVVHAGVVAGFVLVLQNTEAVVPEQADRPDFTISLEQLDADTLIGLVEDVGPTGGVDPDGLPDSEATEPVSVPLEEALAIEGTPEADTVIADEEVDLAALAQEASEAIAAEELAPLDDAATVADSVDTLAPTTDTVNPTETEPIEAATDVVTPVEDAVAAIDAETAPVASGAELAAETADAVAPVAAQGVADTPATLLPAPVAAEAAQPPQDAVAPVAPVPDGPALLPDGPLLTDGAGAAVPSAEAVFALQPESALAVGPIVAPTLPDPGIAAIDGTAVDVAVSAALPTAPVTAAEEVGTQLALIAPDISAPAVTVATAPPIATAPAPGDVGTAVTPAVAPPTVAAAIAPQSQSDALVGREVPPAPSLDARDLALADLIGRIRDAEADPCLLTIPRRSGEDGIGLAMLAASDGAMAAFSDTVLTEDDAGIVQTRTLVDERQCPALAFFQLNRDYPASRLGIRLDAPSIGSGQSLTGLMRGIADRDFMLMLIDNNGVVQDLTRFASVNGDFARFEVPMTRVGPSRDTAPILIAIASRQTLDPLRERMGRMAEEVLSGLPDALSTQAALALTSFDLR